MRNRWVWGTLRSSISDRSIRQCMGRFGCHQPLVVGPPAPRRILWSGGARGGGALDGHLCPPGGPPPRLPGSFWAALAPFAQKPQKMGRRQGEEEPPQQDFQDAHRRN